MKRKAKEVITSIGWLLLVIIVVFFALVITRVIGYDRNMRESKDICIYEAAGSTEYVVLAPAYDMKDYTIETMEDGQRKVTIILKEKER